MRKFITVILVIWSIASFAQRGKVLEEVVAVVGENIILKTDLETEYLQAKESMDFYDGDLKCEVLNQLIIQKLYLHKGKLDSVDVSPERIEAEVDRRVKFYASQIGGERQLERYLGKSIEEYKELMRPKIKEQMITQEVQQGLMSGVKVSPTEVRRFFEKMPEDSIPILETEVEVAQIVMSPKASEVAKEYALETIKEIRKEIMDGKYTFEFAARLKSDDKGTAVNGGELGYFTRGQMVSEFERVAFKLKKDSVSEIVETEFGYHIIQLIDRKGEKLNARHILIKPLILDSDFKDVKVKMDEIISALKKDSASFCKQAAENSEDLYTKDNCGFFSDPTTGAQQVPLSTLDPQVVQKVKAMEIGQYSEPEIFQKYDGSKAYRFFYLKSIKPEHQANLKDDYQKIQTLALAEKQDREVSKWVDEFKVGVYISIDEKYVNCKELSGWKGLN